MWTVQIRDQTAQSEQSDLNLHCKQKLLVSSTASKELKALFQREENAGYVLILILLCFLHL